MPPDALLDEEEQYDSSQDSDFAPDAAGDQGSDQSDIEADQGQPAKRQKTEADTATVDDGYDNSGDETVIKKGEKRQRRAKARGLDEDDEGGEGGLIKTRRQRAAEKEERKYAANNEPVTVDVDALWAQMISGAPAPTDQGEERDENTRDRPDDSTQTEPSQMIRIKRTYNFAGRVHTEEKLVPRDSAEAKLYLASQEQSVPDNDEPAKRVTRRAFRSRFEPLLDLGPQRTDLNLGMSARIQAGKDARARKLNTVEKSRMDWAGFVDKEGIKDELELAGKSKDSYNAREDFLARSEARRDEDSRRARVVARV